MPHISDRPKIDSSGTISSELACVVDNAWEASAVPSRCLGLVGRRCHMSTIANTAVAQNTPTSITPSSSFNAGTAPVRRRGEAFRRHGSNNPSGKGQTTDPTGRNGDYSFDAGAAPIRRKEDELNKRVANSIRRGQPAADVLALAKRPRTRYNTLVIIRRRDNVAQWRRVSTTGVPN